jgi:hypothetical protein
MPGIFGLDIPETDSGDIIPETIIPENGRDY